MKKLLLILSALNLASLPIITFVASNNTPRKDISIIKEQLQSLLDSKTNEFWTISELEIEIYNKGIDKLKGITVHFKTDQSSGDSLLKKGFVFVGNSSKNNDFKYSGEIVLYQELKKLEKMDLENYDSNIFDNWNHVQWIKNQEDDIKVLILNDLKTKTNNKNLSISDFELTLSKPNFGSNGMVIINATENSIYLKSQKTLTIPKLSAVDINNINLSLNLSNDLTAEQVLEALKKVTGITDLTLGDFDFSRTDAYYGQQGIVEISAKTDSTRITGNQTLTISAFAKKDITQIALDLNLSNDLTAEQVLEALKKATGITDLTLGDFDLVKTNAGYGKEGSVKISAKTDSVRISGDQTLTISAFAKKDITQIALDLNLSNDLTDQQVLEALKKATGINDLTLGDFDFSKTDAYYGKQGIVEISAKVDSVRITGNKTLTISVLDKKDITQLDLGLNLSNDLTAEQVLEALKKVTGITDLTLDDFDFSKTDAYYGKQGIVEISAKADSVRITGNQTLTIPAFAKKDITQLVLDLNLSNDLTAEQVLEVLKKATGITDLTLGDFEFNKTDAYYGKEGSVEISAKAESVRITGNKTLTISAFAKKDITQLVLDLNLSNDLTAEQVLEALKKATGISDLTLDDFDLNKTDAYYGQEGSIEISAKVDSVRITGDQTLTISAFAKKDITQLVLDLNLSNDLTAEQVLKALKKVTGINDLTLGDFDLVKTNAGYGKQGIVEISAKTDSVRITGDQNLTISAFAKKDITQIAIDLNLSNDLTKEQILEALKKATGITDLTLGDFDFSKTDAYYGKQGIVEISAKTESVRITGDQTLTIPALAKKDITQIALDLNLSNDLTAEQVLEALKKATGITDLSLGDFDFNKTDAYYGKEGIVEISAKVESVRITGDQTLTISAFAKKDITQLVLDLNLSNDLTAEQVLEALKKVTGINDLTLGDFDFNKTDAYYGQQGSVEISAKTESVRITGNKTLTIPVLDKKDITQLVLDLNLSNGLTAEQVLEALKKATGITDLTFDDFNFNKTDAYYGKEGIVEISAKIESVRITGNKTLTIPVLAKKDITQLVLDLNLSNDLTAEQVLEALKKATGISDLTFDDFNFNKTNAYYGQQGIVEISAKTESVRITGNQTLTIPVLDKKDITQLVLDLNLSNGLTAEQVLEALKKATGITDLTLDDFDFSKTDAYYGQQGSVKISAKAESVRITGNKTLTISALAKNDITQIALDLNLSNDLTAEQVLEALKKATGITDLTFDDFEFNKTDAYYGKQGIVEISAKADSVRITGNQNLTIPALAKKDITQLVLDLNLSNDLTAEQVLEALKKATGINDLTLGDFEFNKTDAYYGKQGSVEITAKAESVRITGNQTLTIPAFAKKDITQLVLDLNLSNDLTKEQILEALKKATGINDLTLGDFEFNKTDAYYGKQGSVEITAKAESVRITGNQTLTISAFAKKDITQLVLDLNLSNDLTAEQVLEALKKATGISDLALDDFDFSKTDAYYGKQGIVEISAKTESVRITGDQTLTISAFAKKDITQLVLDLNLSNDLTAEQVLEALKKVTGISDLTLDDFNFNKTDAYYGKQGIVEISAKVDSVRISGDQTLTIPALAKKDITQLVLDLNLSNDLAKQDVLEALKKATGITDLTLGDFEFNKTDAYYGKQGSVEISAKTESVRISGNKTLRIPALAKKDITQLVLDLNLSNDLTAEQVLEALKKATGISDLALDDFDFSKTDAYYGKQGIVEISAKTDSVRITGNQNLTIPALAKKDITQIALDLNLSNDLTAEQVLEALKKATGISDLTLGDFEFNKTDAYYGQQGIVEISAKTDSVRITGNQNLTIPAFAKKDITQLVLDLNLSNDLTAEQVLEALKKATGINDLTLDDFDFSKTNAGYGKQGIVEISAKVDSVRISGDQTLTISAFAKNDITQIALDLNLSNDLTAEQVLEALKKATGISDLTLDDFDFNKTDAYYGKEGIVEISAKTESVRISGNKTLTISAFSKKDITLLVLDLNLSNDLTKEDVLEALKKATGISDLTLDDFDLNKTDAYYGQEGSIEISAKVDSVRITGNKSLTIPVLAKKDITQLALDLNLSNDLTAEQVLEALKKATGISDLTLGDFDFSKTDAYYGKQGIVEISAKTDSVRITGNKTLTIPKVPPVSLDEIIIKEEFNNDTTDQEILNELQIATGISDLSLDDFTIVLSPSTYKNIGGIIIKAIDESIYLKGDTNFVIPKIPKINLDTISIHIDDYSSINEDDIIKQIKLITGIEDISREDLIIDIIKPDYGINDGSLKITAKDNSYYLIGQNEIVINKFSIKIISKEIQNIINSKQYEQWNKEDLIVAIENLYKDVDMKLSIDSIKITDSKKSSNSNDSVDRYEYVISTKEGGSDIFKQDVITLSEETAQNTSSSLYLTNDDELLVTKDFDFSQKNAKNIYKIGYNSSGNTLNYVNVKYITSVLPEGIKNLANFFNNNSFSTIEGIENWDISKVTNMSRMFENASNFNGDISNWDTSKVTDMSYMFNNASSFNYDISNWDTSNVIKMTYMFSRAKTFNQNISDWNISKVDKIYCMFMNAESFNQDLLTKIVEKDGKTYLAWDTSNVTDMGSMFEGASCFNGDISNWDTSNVITFGAMFKNAILFNQDIGTKMVHIGDREYLAWITKKVYKMDNTFENAESFNQDISNWDTSNVIKMTYMFSGAKTFNQNISDWNISKVDKIYCMFMNAESFNQDLLTKIVEKDGKTYLAWDTSNVTDMGSMFEGASCFNGDISNWDTSNVITFGAMFKNAILFNQDIGTKMVHIGDREYLAWITKKVYKMDNTFENALSFNQDISNWDTSNVITMEKMFWKDENNDTTKMVFNQNLTTWITSKVSKHNDFWNYKTSEKWENQPKFN
ncbi:BspA family leucine-rich repeat surface protein [Mesoplasma corruscae]|uniref:Uncharacterized protein n=1 Tax=Mesoplasma corruscae TaxID=216874 RepID=A0A2S5REE9_9MOLU|nr:BspA family leucine-rich repeat surface protein [Mesoplasma corruscae]PPE05677.1 hypothetical protein MCORR_v1c07050 [Mesoplasma corruscae]